MTYLITALLALPLIGAYALFALGIVVIYRASRVLNLAHGAMVIVPAYVTYSLAQANLPVPIAVAGGVLSGGVLGLIVERVFVRTLRDQSVTTQTVGTVAAFGLILALISRIYGTTPLLMPAIFPRGFVQLGHSGIKFGAIGLFATMLVLAALMFALFRFTALGLAMRGAAENARAAMLMGINPQRTTEIAWALGGTLAGVAGILLASITSLEPFNLSLQALPAFVAVLIGGLESLGGALIGAALVGAVVGILPGLPLLGNVQGASQVLLVGIAFVVMARRGQRLSTGDLRA
jgi:branched-subunit amino acid ABC-type transport system permease component